MFKKLLEAIGAVAVIVKVSEIIASFATSPVSAVFVVPLVWGLIILIIASIKEYAIK